MVIMNKAEQFKHNELDRFSQDLRVAIDVAHKAGIAIKAARGGAVELKSGISNVQTTGDINSHTVIVRELGLAFPTDSVLSEESNNTVEAPSTIARLWVADPLDGSKNFADGINDVWVSLGLVKLGKTAVGVTHNPFTNTTYFAELGKGSYVIRPNNNEMEIKQLQVAQRSELKHATIETSISYDERESNNHDLIKLFLSFQGLDVRDRRIGTSVGQLCRVAEGISDLHMHSGLKPWDYVAAILILQEAGGIAKTMNNQNFNSLTDKDNISGNDMLVVKLVSEISQLKGNSEFITFLAERVNNFHI